MSNTDQENRDGARTYMDHVCDNCGREINSEGCPYCDFVYRQDEDENGVFYY
jgi:hypothetical protein